MLRIADMRTQHPDSLNGVIDQAHYLAACADNGVRLQPQAVAKCLRDLAQWAEFFAPYHPRAVQAESALANARNMQSGVTARFSDALDVLSTIAPLLSQLDEVLKPAV